MFCEEGLGLIAGHRGSLYPLAHHEGLWPVPRGPAHGLSHGAPWTLSLSFWDSDGHMLDLAGQGLLRVSVGLLDEGHALAAPGVPHEHEPQTWLDLHFGRPASMARMSPGCGFA